MGVEEEEAVEMNEVGAESEGEQLRERIDEPIFAITIQALQRLIKCSQHTADASCWKPGAAHLR